MSDIDFLDWTGRTLVGDDMDDHDSRCNSAIIHTMLKPEYGENTEDRRSKKLCTQTMKIKLSKTICKFPSEWVRDDVETH